ncbi:hypothetical protein Taro_034750 [Colocasia esculenta]|uniref:Uncharacterized protein n=1 Tax=Colocasia esculenta TaxID=4460 RepID=A0A843WGF7_COLES|nr:hypothetical protein [Colocasia esculenta]
MERHKPIPQFSFPCCIRTPKTHRCLNTLHQTLGSSSTTCWGQMEELLVAGEQEMKHTKPIFFPLSSVATCKNHPLEVDQRTTICQNRESLVRNPKHCPFSVGRRPRT